MNRSVHVRELSPSTLPDYLRFFDRDAFPDNPDWASCYCCFHHADHDRTPWEKRTGAENRATVCSLIGAGAMRGYLAYVEDLVVGWCHAAPRRLIPNVEPGPDDLGVPEETVGSIVCFLVAPTHRGEGVATRLLESALAGFRRDGLTTVLAYPRRHAVGAAMNYHGPTALYLRAGFEVLREYEKYSVVGKDLRQEPA
jgi:GNAT superfamily N-acetyltransferase